MLRRRRFRPSLRTVESFGSVSSHSVATIDLYLPSSEKFDVLPKPNIFTLTAFIQLTGEDFENPSDYSLSLFPALGAKIDQVVSRLRKLGESYKEEGYKVSSLNIATNPFGEWLLQNDEFVLAERLEFLRSLLQRHGIMGCCLGPARNLRQLAYVRQILAVSERFHCVFVLNQDDVLAAKAVQEVICDISSLDPHGLSNTRFCVAAKTCRAWNPFFPVAYFSDAVETIENKRGPSTVFRFAIGLESGQLLDHLLHSSGCLDKLDTLFRQGMIEALAPIQIIAENFCSVASGENTTSEGMGRIREIDNAFHDAMVHALFPPGLDHECHIRKHNKNERSGIFTANEFMGIDTTIGFPYKTGSVAHSLERLSDIDEFGDPKTFAACDAIRAVLQSLESIKLTGFCGISIPIGSDSRFLQLLETNISIDRLLQISTSCANGLDMVSVSVACLNSDDVLITVRERTEDAGILYVHA